MRFYAQKDKALLDPYVFGLTLFAMFGVLILALTLVSAKGIKVVEAICKFLKEVVRLILL